MKIIKLFNLALSFFLEICMLAAYCYWGFSVHGSTFANIAFGIFVPVGVIIFWALYIAPKAKYRIEGSLLDSITFFLFVLSAYALLATGQTTLAFIFFVLIMINLILNKIFGQSDNIRK